MSWNALKLSLVFILLTAASFQNTAFADTSADSTPSNFIAELKSRIHKVSTPFYTYHWQRLSPGQTDPSQLSQAQLYKEIVRAIGLQKQQYVKGGGYDGGYYVALDPVASRTFGGTPGATDWSLTRIEVPVGFRYLDIAQTVDIMEFPDAASTEFANHALKALKPYCPFLEMTDFLNGGKGAFVEPRDTEQSCLKVLDQIVRELNVDGLFYSYGQTPIFGCDNSHKGALVFTRADWLQPNQILSFTRLTTGNIQERQYIQSFLGGAMFQASNDFQASDSQVKAVYAYYMEHPQELVDSLQGLEAYGDEMSKLIPKTDAEKRTITYYSFKKIMRKMADDDNAFAEQLWPDLLQSPTKAEGLAWSKQHLLQCSEKN
jgi:hypothetical protein